MATGMVNTSNTMVDAPATIRSGEKLASTQAALKDPKSKTFYHTIPGARFIMPDGLEVVFMGGQVTTNDPDVIRELEAVADRNTSLIYTQKAGTQAAQAAQKLVADDAAKAAVQG
jgi:hypothetical protein